MDTRPARAQPSYSPAYSERLHLGAHQHLALRRALLDAPWCHATRDECVNACVL